MKECEGVKVRRPNEFDFIIKIDALTNKPLFHLVPFFRSLSIHLLVTLSYLKDYHPTSVFSDMLRNTDGQESSSGEMCSETHDPATTLYIQWQGGKTVHPPVSDHPKCRAKSAAYGRWSLKRA